MHHFKTSLWLAAVTGLLLPAAAALAQAPSATPRPDPADPRAAAPPLQHRSALTAYRRLGADAPLAWREANERVERIGGWRAYAREAQAPTPAATPASAVPAR